MRRKAAGLLGWRWLRGGVRVRASCACTVTVAAASGRWSLLEVTLGFIERSKLCVALSATEQSLHVASIELGAKGTTLYNDALNLLLHIAYV